MLTAGIDLAAEPDRTASAIVEWQDKTAAVVDVTVGVTDDQAVQAVMRATKAGIDCPFGWPERFVDLVVAHRNATLPAPESADRSWRRDLVLRETDRHIHRRTGLTPLSVSADRIGHVALRCAALLARLAASGVDCARDGSGRVAEVYPAGALRQWGLPHRGYKRIANESARHRLVDSLAGHSRLAMGAAEQECRRSDDALDAVVSALVARAVFLGLTEPAQNIESARTEGWIHLPTGDLSELINTT